MNISSLALTATPQAVTAVTTCHTITVKEDESVANWPTVSIWISATASSTPNKLTAGKSFTFEAPGIPWKLRSETKRNCFGTAMGAHEDG